MQCRTLTFLSILAFAAIDLGCTEDPPDTDEQGCDQLPWENDIDLSVENALTIEETETLVGQPALVRTDVGDKDEDGNPVLIDLRATLTGFNALGFQLGEPLPLLWLDTASCDARWREYGGAVAGMSGSPVVIDGRLAGALSYTWGPRLEPPYNFGATPIERMLAVNDETEGGVMVGFAAPPSGGPGPIGAVLSGFDLPPGLDLGTIDLPDTVRPVAGGASADCLLTESITDLDCELPSLQPGSAIAVPVIMGDNINLTAIGTVTAVSNDRVWAFGHPFFASGPTSLPYSAANILAISSNPLWSYKVGHAQGSILGEITQDRMAAISGSPGEPGNLRRYTMRLRGDIFQNDVPTEKMVVHRVPAVVDSFYHAYGMAAGVLSAADYWLEGSAEVTITTRFRGQNDALTEHLLVISDWGLFDAVFFGSWMSRDNVARLETRFPETDPISTEIEVGWTASDLQLDLSELSVYDVDNVDEDASVVAQRARIVVNVSGIDHLDGSVQHIERTIEIPADAPLGYVDLNVDVMPPLLVNAPAPAAAETLEEEIDRLNQADADDNDDDLFVTISGVLPDGTYGPFVSERITGLDRLINPWMLGFNGYRSIEIIPTSE